MCRHQPDILEIFADVVQNKNTCGVSPQADSSVALAMIDPRADRPTGVTLGADKGIEPMACTRASGWEKGQVEDRERQKIWGDGE
jgi:hypothetical protein